VNECHTSRATFWRRQGLSLALMNGKVKMNGDTLCDGHYVILSQSVWQWFFMCYLWRNDRFTFCGPYPMCTQWLFKLYLWPVTMNAVFPDCAQRMEWIDTPHCYILWLWMTFGSDLDCSGLALTNHIGIFTSNPENPTSSRRAVKCSEKISKRLVALQL